MKNRKIPHNFEVSVYGDLVPYALNPLYTQARVRTFYKYKNRNQTYFSSEVADSLIETMKGLPIVGYFDRDKQDFLPHFPVRDSKAYGYVPAHDHGFAWEEHMDDDGVLRTYACFNVVLWTNRYAEANLIPGKKQSMELDPHTIEGQWITLEDEGPVFYYTKAEASGLCVLGDTDTPCFEGAAFYTQESQEQFTALLHEMREEIKKNFSTEQVEKDKEVKNTMPFKFNEKAPENFALLFDSVNPNFNEEAGFVVDSTITEVGDGQFVAYNLEEGTLSAYTYTIEEDKVSLGDATPLTSGFVLTAQNEALTAQLAEVEASIADYQAKLEQVADYQEKVEAIAAFETQIATLEEEKSALAAQVAEYQQKEAAEAEEKKSNVIDSYSEMLPEETLANARAEQANFTLEELDSHLALQFAKLHKKEKGPYFPSGQTGDVDPMLVTLENYRKLKGE